MIIDKFLLFTSGFNSCRENSALLIEQSRCLSHLSYVYHSLHQNNRSLMAALEELNSAEEAEENLHEVKERKKQNCSCAFPCSISQTVASNSSFVVVISVLRNWLKTHALRFVPSAVTPVHSKRMRILYLILTLNPKLNPNLVIVLLFYRFLYCNQYTVI